MICVPFLVILVSQCPSYVVKNKASVLPLVQPGARLGLGRFRAGGLFASGSSPIVEVDQAGDAYDGMLLASSALGFLDIGLSWATLSAIASTDGLGGHALVFTPDLGPLRLGLGGGVLWRDGKAWPTGTGLLALDAPVGFTAFLAGRYGQGPGRAIYTPVFSDTSAAQAGDTSYSNTAVSVGAGVDFTGLPYMGLSLCLNLASTWAYDLVENQPQEVSLVANNRSFLRLEVGLYFKNF
jgi:hypothetical protein